MGGQMGGQEGAGTAERRVRRHVWRWFLYPLLFALLLVALLPATLWWLADTAPGRAFVARQLAAIRFESGLRYQVGRLDGSLWSSFTAREVVVQDLDGVLLRIPVADVSWTPLALLSNRVDIARIDIPSATLLRAPHLNPSDPDEPLLPAVDIRVGEFSLPALTLAEPLVGREEQLALSGGADIRSGRLLLTANLDSTARDRVRLTVDAEPDGDRFELSAALDAPETGVLATLSGLRRAVRMTAKGEGSWSRWRGTAQGRIADREGTTSLVPLFDLALAADGGRFQLTGTLDAKPLLGERGRSLLGPALRLQGTAEPVAGARQRTALGLSLIAAAGSLSGKAVIDRRQSRLIDGVADIALDNPRALSPMLTGRGLRLQLRGEGPLRAPDLSFTATAERLRIATDTTSSEAPVGADGLQLSGQLLRAGDGEASRWRLPFTLRAAALAGVPAPLAPLLAAPHGEGVLTIAGRNMAATAQVQTAALSLRAQGQANEAGTGSTSVTAQLRRYEATGLGAMAGDVSLRLPLSNWQVRQATGRFSVRALALSNAALVQQLGGLPVLDGSFRLSPAQIELGETVLDSPRLNVRVERGLYRFRQRQLDLVASGGSEVLGDFQLTAGGSLDSPQAELRMPAPGFGIRNLVASLGTDEGALLLQAKGESAPGPLDARIRILHPADGPLAIAVEHLGFAGLAASGRLERQPSGHFAGGLDATGRGLSGHLSFADAAGVQQIDLAMDVRNAQIPLQTPIAIASGRAGFRLLLRDEPRLTGSFGLRGVSRAGVVLAEANLAADLSGTRGIASFRASGRSGDGQALAIDSRLQSTADGYALALSGKVGRQPLALASPARLRPVDDGWELRPALLRLPKGEVTMAGRIGPQSELRLGLKDVDLAILDVFRAGLGLGGVANGSVVVRLGQRSRIPAGAADLRIAGLERAGVTGMTVPVDVRLSGRSDDGGLRLGARVSWQENELGRVVANVEPGAGSTPAARFLAGTLTGGIRYNGPVEPVWALFGSEGQELKGPIAIAADFAGTPSEPQLRGSVRGAGLVYRNAGFGTEVTDIGFAGRFTANMLQVSELGARANGGTIRGRGFIRFGDDGVINLTADLEKARLANSELLDLTLSGPVRVSGRGSRATLSGDLSVDNARIQLVQVANSEVPELKVRREGAITVPAVDSSLSPRNLALDLRIRADDRVRVEGMGLDSTWRGDIHVGGTALAPDLSGIANLARGEFVFAGSDFDLTGGRVVLNGKPLDTAIDIRAETDAADVTALVTISGTAGRPVIHFSSTPTLPEDEILSRLLFGTSVADLSVTEAVQLATAVAGLQSGVDSMGKIRRAVGVDRLRLVGDNQTNGMGTGLAIGKRLTRNLYAEVLTDSQGQTLTTLQWTLSRIWSLFVDLSSIGQGSANIRYQREN